MTRVELPISLEADGRFNEPSFHDAIVTGIEIVDRSTEYVASSPVDIYISTEYPKESYRLALLGTEVFNGFNLFTGNVIFDVQCINATTIDAAPESWVYQQLERLYSPQGRQWGPAVNDLSSYVDRIRTGEIVLVLLDPTFGFELAAICREVKVVKITE
jgi:hypothetical protein